jgi:hypothetical protein
MLQLVNSYKTNHVNCLRQPRGDYLEQAKGLVSGNEMVSGALDKLKGLF